MRAIAQRDQVERRSPLSRCTRAVVAGSVDHGVGCHGRRSPSACRTSRTTRRTARRSKPRRVLRRLAPRVAREDERAAAASTSSGGRSWRDERTDGASTRGGVALARRSGERRGEACERLDDGGRACGGRVVPANGGCGGVSEPLAKIRRKDEASKGVFPLAFFFDEDAVDVIVYDAGKVVPRAGDRRDAEKTGFEVLDAALRLCEDAVGLERRQVHVRRGKELRKPCSRLMRDLQDPLSERLEACVE